MSDLLAIIDQSDTDDTLLDEIVRRHPDRVTVLLEEHGPGDWAADDTQRAKAVRDQLAALLTAIEQRSGAVVVGLAGSRDQLQGWRFDRIVGGRRPLTV